MSAPWNRKKKAEPIARARTTAPSSSNRQSQPPPPRPRTQSLCYRQRFHQRLNQFQWPAHYTEEHDGPEHARQWKITYFTGNTPLGTSDWFTNKDAAKENAAMRALAWMDEYAAAQAQAQEQAQANGGH